jgi:hypothetical protein
MADNDFQNALTTELKAIDNVQRAPMWYERNVNVLMEKDHGWMSFEDMFLNDLAELTQYCAGCTHPRIFLNLIKNVIETKKKLVALAQQPVPPAENVLPHPVPEEGAVDPPIPRPPVADQPLEAHVLLSKFDLDFASIPTNHSLSKALSAKDDFIFPNFSFTEISKELGLSIDSDDSNESDDDFVEKLKHSIKDRKEKMPKNLTTFMLFVEDITSALTQADVWTAGQSTSYRKLLLRLSKQYRSTRVAIYYDRFYRANLVKYSKSVNNKSVPVKKPIDYSSLIKIDEAALSAATNVENDKRSLDQKSKQDTRRQRTNKQVGNWTNYKTQGTGWTGSQYNSTSNGGWNGPSGWNSGWANANKTTPKANKPSEEQ